MINRTENLKYNLDFKFQIKKSNLRNKQTKTPIIGLNPLIYFLLPPAARYYYPYYSFSCDTSTFFSVVTEGKTLIFYLFAAKEKNNETKTRRTGFFFRLDFSVAHNNNVYTYTLTLSSRSTRPKVSPPSARSKYYNFHYYFFVLCLKEAQGRDIIEKNT